MPEPAGAHHAGRMAWARVPARTAALCPVSPPASKRLLQEIFPAAGKINSVGAAGCSPCPGLWGRGGGQGTATTTPGPCSSQGSWALLPLHRPRALAPGPGHRATNPGDFGRRCPPCPDPGRVICHPHPAQQSRDTLGAVSWDGFCGDSLVLRAAGMLPDAWPWLAGGGGPTRGHPPPDTWGHALILLLAFLVAEGAEPAAPRKSVSPQTGSPGARDGMSPGGTRHRHRGGQRGRVLDGAGACRAQIQRGITVFSDTGGT